jgi:hypothetical protein
MIKGGGGASGGGGLPAVGRWSAGGGGLGANGWQGDGAPGLRLPSGNVAQPLGAEGWNGYTGEPPAWDSDLGSRASAIAGDDADVYYIGSGSTVGAGYSSVFTLPAVITNRLWRITFKARRYVGSPIASGSVFRFAICANNGLYYESAPFDTTVLTDAWEEYSVTVDTAGALGTPTAGLVYGPNNLIITAHSSSQYAFITFVKVIPA